MIAMWTRRAGVLAAALVLLPAALARADGSTQLSVVGTSDVSDSGLSQNVIQPEFTAAFPQFTYTYTGSATGKAIQNAENGVGTPSVLIVHAPSLENQFVAGGYSLNNDYGHAIFTNDFVFAGPTADPAGVDPGGASNIAQAFADVAAAGVGGTAEFFSRGGSNNAPGTTVEEHQIWKLVNDSGLTPAGVVLCTVSAADGGGMTPIDPGTQSTSGQPCPDSGTVDGSNSDRPSWYQINNVNQAMNVIEADACSPADCYALTDRGTYDYLASGDDPLGKIQHLKIVTRGPQPASAPGGPNALINYFHVYIINPNAPGGHEQVNVTAAQDFVTLLTSVAFQSQLKTYLDYTADAAVGGPPFVADASPTINVTSGFPATATAGNKLTLTGKVVNSEPGFPNPSGAAVSIDDIAGGTPVPVASSTTSSDGSFSIPFTPASSGSYQLSTGQISQVEEPNLSPVYGDILSPAATNPATLTLQGTATISSANGTAGGATVSGTVGPAAPDKNAEVAILARPQGSSGSFTQVNGETLSAGQSSFAVNVTLKPGKWELEASYRDPGQFESATSAGANVTVGATSTSVSFMKRSVKKGKLTVTGALSPAPVSSGGKVELFAMRTVAVGKSKTVRHHAARAAAASFKQIGKTSIAAGKRTFTIKAKLTRGFQWVLQLQYVHSGQPSSFSRLSSVNVH
jgi:ABC-type tungstate transport system permease subunit